MTGPVKCDTCFRISNFSLRPLWQQSKQQCYLFYGEPHHLMTTGRSSKISLVLSGPCKVATYCCCNCCCLTPEGPMGSFIFLSSCLTPYNPEQNPNDSATHPLSTDIDTNNRPDKIYFNTIT